MSDVLDHELTKEQRAIVSPTAETDTFVVACPGAGKTRMIVARFIERAAQLPANRGIAVLSFTNAAATEVQTRCRAHDIRDLCSFPHFVGTFDAFINRYLVMPFGSPWHAGYPTIIESWNRLGIEIRPPGSRGKSFGMPLDAFPVGDDLEITLPRVPPQNVRKEVAATPEAWLSAAKRYRRGLLGKGLITCADARALGLKRVRDPSLGPQLAKALGARFREAIIDEAQDCDRHELELIRWLRSAGIQTTLVCDPDQAIFEFRGGDRQGLRALSAQLDPKSLSGNFRSTQHICGVAATLRSRPADTACGNEAEREIPPILISYEGKKVSSAIGAAFMSVLKSYDDDRKDIVVLAHKHRHAHAAAGKLFQDRASEAQLVRLAGAVSHGRRGAIATRVRAALGLG